ncbi:hypothetical protein VaNZ11_015554, partial [Volvox africanus]
MLQPGHGLGSAVLPGSAPTTGLQLPPHQHDCPSHAAHQQFQNQSAFAYTPINGPGPPHLLVPGSGDHGSTGIVSGTVVVEQHLANSSGNAAAAAAAVPTAYHSTGEEGGECLSPGPHYHVPWPHHIERYRQLIDRFGLRERLSHPDVEPVFIKKVDMEDLVEGPPGKARAWLVSRLVVDHCLYRPTCKVRKGFLVLEFEVLFVGGESMQVEVGYKDIHEDPTGGRFYVELMLQTLRAKLRLRDEMLVYRDKAENHFQMLVLPNVCAECLTPIAGREDEALICDNCMDFVDPDCCGMQLHDVGDVWLCRWCRDAESCSEMTLEGTITKTPTLNLNQGAAFAEPDVVRGPEPHADQDPDTTTTLATSSALVRGWHGCNGGSGEGGGGGAGEVVAAPAAEGALASELHADADSGTDRRGGKDDAEIRAVEAAAMVAAGHAEAIPVADGAVRPPEVVGTAAGAGKSLAAATDTVALPSSPPALGMAQVRPPPPAVEVAPFVPQLADTREPLRPPQQPLAQLQPQQPLHLGSALLVQQHQAQHYRREPSLPPPPPPPLPPIPPQDFPSPQAPRQTEPLQQPLAIQQHLLLPLPPKQTGAVPAFPDRAEPAAVTTAAAVASPPGLHGQVEVQPFLGLGGGSSGGEPAAAAVAATAPAGRLEPQPRQPFRSFPPTDEAAAAAAAAAAHPAQDGGLRQPPETSMEQIISAILQPDLEPPQQQEQPPQTQMQQSSWSLPAPDLCSSLGFATSLAGAAGTGEDQQPVPNPLSAVDDSALVHSSSTMPGTSTGLGSQSTEGLMMTVEVTAGDEDPRSGVFPDNVRAAAAAVRETAAVAQVMSLAQVRA